jgi:hypothetical protein
MKMIILLSLAFRPLNFNVCNCRRDLIFHLVLRSYNLVSRGSLSVSAISLEGDRAEEL